MDIFKMIFSIVKDLLLRIDSNWFDKIFSIVLF